MELTMQDVEDLAAAAQIVERVRERIGQYAIRVVAVCDASEEVVLLGRTRELLALGGTLVEREHDHEVRIGTVTALDGGPAPLIGGAA